ncbi:MAG: response regulator [Gammaproteobacteria bacterium]|nr:response regulator [Gammaproteobacteria bacterium]
MFFDRQLSRAKILIVDDDPLNINLLRVILEDAGYQVDMLENGDEVLNKITEIKPDLIILDISLSDINGYDICYNIRQLQAFVNLPVIMIITLASAEDRLCAFEAGVTSVINKPFDKQELIKKIRSNLVCEEVKKPEIAICQLPKAMIITSPNWVILSLSQSAADLLKIPCNDIVGKDLLAVFRDDGLTMPMDERGPFSLTFNTQIAYFQGEHNPVKDSSGRLVLRVLVLSDVFPHRKICLPEY